MREHPIPQDITGYRFHLIGNMTLKQFAMILAGAILALIFYKTNLPSFIRYPVALGFAISGLAAAFVPIEGRPLDQWIVNFIKVLYKPTKFDWKREPQIPDAFTYEPPTNQKQQDAPVDLSPIRKDRVKEFLQSINHPQIEKDEFEIEEEKRVDRVLQTFNNLGVSEQKGIKQAQKPNLKVRVRKMKAMNPAVIYDKNKQAEGDAQLFEEISEENQELENQKFNKPNQNQEEPPMNVDEATAVQQESHQEQPEEQEEQEEVSEETNQGLADQTSVPAAPVFNGSAQQASYNQDLPFPNKPSRPNQLVGMTLSASNNLISGARIEIQNERGSTITAVKSNALGQFFITQSLPSGTYFIKTRHDNYEFNPLRIDLKNEIVEPLEIRAEN